MSIYVGPDGGMAGLGDDIFPSVHMGGYSEALVYVNGDDFTLRNAGVLESGDGDNSAIATVSVSGDGADILNTGTIISSRIGVLVEDRGPCRHAAFFDDQQR